MRSMTVWMGIFCLAALASAESLLILPIGGDVGKSGDASSINQLYRDAVEAQFKGSLLPETGPQCADRTCALQAVREVPADQVIYSTVNHLGSKWIFSSTILRSDGSDVYNQRLTALSIEDMEAVTKHMADALMSRKTIEQVVTVDNITQKDETKEPERRISLYSAGLGVGYIFPQTRDDFNNKSINENSSYTPIIRLAWLNNWQFKNNLLLNTDLLWGMGAEVAGDANLDYLFGRGDFSPFVGGGVGLHYVYSDSAGRSSGLALTAQSGVMLFRTYDINVMLRGYYQVILNSNVDKGAGFDVDITYRNNNAAKQQASSGGGGFFTYVGYVFVGLLVVSIIAAASN